MLVKAKLTKKPNLEAENSYIVNDIQISKRTTIVNRYLNWILSYNVPNANLLQELNKLQIELIQAK